MATKTRFQKIYFYFSLTIVLALFVLIFCLSHQSGEDSTETSGWFTALLNFVFPFELTENFVRTMAHFSEFAALGMSFTWLFGMLSGKKAWYLSLPLICGAAAAAIDETIQLFSPDRGPSIKDVGIDTCGVITGIAVLSLLHWLFTHKKR